MKSFNSFAIGPIALLVSIVLNLINTVKIEEKWASPKEFRTPESVIFDSLTNTIYVSNINKVNLKEKDRDGFISKLSPTGKIEILEWVKGLNDPKGMAVYQNSLYVADIDEIVEISLPSGHIKKRYPVEGAKFLNDLAVDENGTIYVSDSDTHKIYTLIKDKVSVWLEGEELKQPNGLLLLKKNLFMNSMDGNSVRKISLESKDVTVVFSPVPSADGIATDYKGNFFVSNFNGEVYMFKNQGESEKILDTKEAKISAADIAFIPNYNLLLVPTFFDNRVIAYEVIY